MFRVSEVVFFLAVIADVIIQQFVKPVSERFYSRNKHFYRAAMAVHVRRVFGREVIVPCILCLNPMSDEGYEVRIGGENCAIKCWFDNWMKSSL